MTDNVAKKCKKKKTTEKKKLQQLSKLLSHHMHDPIL
jgi:hypothetical protein